MTRNSEQALAWCLSQSTRPTRDWTDDCYLFTRTAYDLPAVGDVDGNGRATAVDGWKAAKHRHPETDPHKIPRGVPVFWSGGSHGDGHAAPSVGGGQIWTTDLIRPGRIDLAPISLVHRQWGLTLLGWTEDLGGHVIERPTTNQEGRPMTEFEKRMIASNTRLEAMLEAEMRANGHSKQLAAALEAAEQNNRHKGVI